MALKILDLFKSIKWAKNGDVTDMSQTNYEAGWAHLGDDTPTVEDFNLVQKLNDEKDQWLFNQIESVCDAKNIPVTEDDAKALLKAINTSATLSRAGITQLSSAIDSTIETMAATPKAIKSLKDLIDALTRNLNNYIPNSKKSNVVNSNSADTVATSAAVKSANDNANGRVSKSGDTMTGNLTIDNVFPLLIGKRNRESKYAVGLRNANSDDVVLVRYGSQVAIELLEDRIHSDQPFYEGNNKLHSVSVIKGVVDNRAVLPLPSGYSASQCHWIVSISEDISLSRIEDSNTGYTKTECYVDSNRRVIARVYSKVGANTDSATGKKFDNSRANYLVIGVK